MSKLFIALILALQFTSLCYANERLARIQERTRPYPYIEEEVTYKNPVDGVLLSGTLTYPTTQGPFPVVILLHGSAPLDRDESLFGHKPFLVWADYLTRQGIAVLRFDKRGAGKSTGNYDTSTIQDFANDALAGVEYLKTRKEINSKQIGLIGHSEGGMTAPLAASKSKDVSFIVLMAGPGVTLKQIMNVQVELLLKADGVPEETIALSRELLGRILTIVEEQKDQKIAATQLRSMFLESFNVMTSEQKVIIESYYGKVEDQITLFNSVSFRYWLTYDPLKALRLVKIPVLALNGELDMQVSSKENLPAIAKALNEAGNKDYTILELPRINHFFQACHSGSIKEYSEIEETISPAVLHLMSTWILDRTRCKKR